LIISLFLVFLTRIPFSFSLKRLAAVTMFVGPFFIVMPLTMPTKAGDTIYYFTHLEFMEINARGLLLAGTVYLKAIAIVLLVVPMFGTNRFDISIKALERLKVPNKIVQMILFSYRYIFVFLAEMRRMMVGMQVRGFEQKSDTHTLRTMGNFVGVLLVRSFERTERVYHAMLSRGYKGVLNTYFDYKITGKDVLKGVFVSAACGIIIFQDRIFAV
jgi:cobalt/nickel transport system permease protein